MGSKYLGALRGPVYFHTEVVPVLLPMEFAVYHVEQVAHPDLLPGGELHQGHPRWDIFVFRDPKGNDVSPWGPGEVSEGQQGRSISKRRRRIPTQTVKSYFSGFGRREELIFRGHADFVRTPSQKQHQADSKGEYLLDPCDFQTFLIQQAHGLERQKRQHNNPANHTEMIFSIQMFSHEKGILLKVPKSIGVLLHPRA